MANSIHTRLTIKYHHPESRQKVSSGDNWEKCTQIKYSPETAYTLRRTLFVLQYYRAECGSGFAGATQVWNESGVDVLIHEATPSSCWLYMLRARRLSLQFSECDLLIIITVIIIICSGCCYPCCTEFQYGKPPQSLYLSTAHTHFPRLGPSAIQRPHKMFRLCFVSSRAAVREPNTITRAQHWWKPWEWEWCLQQADYICLWYWRWKAIPDGGERQEQSAWDVYIAWPTELTLGRRPYRLRVVARDCNYCCKFRTDHKDYYYIWSVLYILCVKFLGFCYSLEYVCQQMRVDSTRGGFRIKCFKVSRSVVNLDDKEESRNRITSTVGSVNNIETRK